MFVQHEPRAGGIDKDRALTTQRLCGQGGRVFAHIHRRGVELYELRISDLGTSTSGHAQRLPPDAGRVGGDLSLIHI